MYSIEIINQMNKITKPRSKCINCGNDYCDKCKRDMMRTSEQIERYKNERIL